MNKILKNVQWSFIALTVSAGCSFLLRVLYGKELGASGLGIYTLVLNIYMVGALFATFGSDSALTKYVAENIDNVKDVNSFIYSGLLFSLFWGLLSGFLLYTFSNFIAISFFHEPDLASLLKIVSICFPVLGLKNAVLGVLNGLQKMELFALCNILYNIFVLVASFILVISLSMAVQGAILGFVGPTIMVGLISIMLVRKFIFLERNEFNLQFRSIFYFGFYAVLANSISILNTQVDSFLIGYYMNPTEVGYYSCATVLVQPLTIIPAAIQKVTTPTIAHYYGKHDYVSIRHLMKKTMINSSLVILVVSIILIYLSRYLIIFFFNEDFLSAYTPLLILIIGFSTFSIYVSVGSCLSSIGKVEIIFKINMLCALINAVLNIFLIPRFGIIGAASATTISLVVTTIINLFIIQRIVFRNKQ